MMNEGGRDTDGQGTTGIVEEKSRPARPGETDTTRFGMEKSEAEEPNVTGGSNEYTPEPIANENDTDLEDE